MENSKTQMKKKTIWTKMAIWTKSQELKWQFTQKYKTGLTTEIHIKHYALTSHEIFSLLQDDNKKNALTITNCKIACSKNMGTKCK
ncbi:hypothetical protein Hanom_Chr02g00121551 [Helianthus anomalus]